MPVPNASNTYRGLSPGNWGAASRFDFDNPQKWHTEPEVPIMVDHEITDDSGKVIGYWGQKEMMETARNNNRRVQKTGDPATLILGHTSDDPKAPEKPAQGFAVNYKVRPFKDPESGHTRYEMVSDWKFRHNKKHLVEEYPRRSVELWMSKREIDPIAMLGGTTPELDMGALIRRSRISNIIMSRTTIGSSGIKAIQGSQPGDVLYYAARGGYVYRYGMGEECNMNPNRYGMGEDDDLPPEDDTTGDGDNMDDGGGSGFDDGAQEGDGEDPMVAKVLASKPMRDLMDKVNQIFDAVTGGAEGGAGPGAGGMGGEPGMDDGMGMGAPAGAGGPGGGAMPPPPPGAGGMGGPGGNPDEEAAMFHGAPPVRFGEGEDDAMDYSASGFAGPASTHVPAVTGGRKKPFSRNGNHNTGGAGMNGTRARGNQPQPEVVRLQRQVKDMALKLARADAEKIVASLKDEGVVFGDSPEEAAKSEAEQIEFLATLDENGRKWRVNDIRRNYRRRELNPGQPGAFGPASHYARGGPETQSPTGADDTDFNPTTPQEAVVYAAAVERFGGDREKATKYMRGQGKRRA